MYSLKEFTPFRGLCLCQVDLYYVSIVRRPSETIAEQSISSR